MFRSLGPLLLTLAAATPALAGPLQVTSRVLAQVPQRAADGTMTVAMRPAARAVPGDRVVFELTFRNTGTQPLAGVVFDNPVPAGVAYRAPAPGSAAPEVSVDGRRFATIDALRVGDRPARADDVTHVRWRLARPLAAGAQGRLAFLAVLK
ncbi:DUF11 domain-containing protein [Sphingomonas endophytica]|uniref:DUF11 domain-containing protein n=1 Tax=Sphingomonas endophytica TaxID=869719 RepID=A0A147I5F3_9SPHN|nr:DUF11 domain-containing protein [Sphingomonas endophytica]KTT73873.1 hypothetical protein NS334_06490 [Sphingomonas endophytica]